MPGLPVYGVWDEEIVRGIRCPLLFVDTKQFTVVKKRGKPLVDLGVENGFVCSRDCFVKSARGFFELPRPKQNLTSVF